MRRMILALAIAAVAVPSPSWAGPENDQQIAQRIADTLTGSGRLKGYSIAVKYNEGTAHLEGWVRSSQQMTQALEIVNQAPEVKGVVNNLAIRQEPAVTRATPGRPQTFQEVPQGQPIAQIPAQPATVTNPYAVPEGAATQGVTPASETQFGPVLQRAEYPAMQLQPTPEPSQAQPQQQQQAPRAAARPARNRAGLASRIRPQARTASAQARSPQMASQQGNGAPMQAVPVVQEQQQQIIYGNVPPGAPMQMGPPPGTPLPAYAPTGMGPAPAVYDQPYMPNYAWPGYAAYPNYAAVTYPKQYSPAAWPYIGPFYPYPQVPLGWRKVTLEWDDGWWFVNFQDDRRHCHH